MVKMAKKYVVTFGKAGQPTQHQFETKQQAVSKAKALKHNLPNISFRVTKAKKPRRKTTKYSVWRDDDYVTKVVNGKRIRVRK